MIYENDSICILLEGIMINIPSGLQIPAVYGIYFNIPYFNLIIITKYLKHRLCTVYKDNMYAHVYTNICLAYYNLLSICVYIHVSICVHEHTY